MKGKEIVLVEVDSSAVPTPSKDDFERVLLAFVRDFFPDLSSAEIDRLYSDMIAAQALSVNAIDEAFERFMGAEIVFDENGDPRLGKALGDVLTEYCNDREITDVALAETLAVPVDAVRVLKLSRHPYRTSTIQKDAIQVAKTVPGLAPFRLNALLQAIFVFRNLRREQAVHLQAARSKN